MKLNYYILALLTSALMAQAAPPPTPVIITALPFTITAPGTYVLTGNLTLPPQSSLPASAIKISLPIAGPVVVDLKGHTITGQGLGYNGISIGNAVVSNIYPITVRNGAIQSFSTGVIANVGCGSSASLSSITINSIAFSITASPGTDSYGILFQGVGSSSINGCTIDGASYGILDSCGGGNSYNNDTFSRTVDTPLEIMNVAKSTAFVLDRCQFNPVVK